MRRFEAVLTEHRGGTVLELPFDVPAVFGSRRPPVRATINGFTFPTTVFSMGGRFLLGLNREVRERAAVAAGDRVIVELELDEEPRTVDVPADLAAALDADRDVRAHFDRLSYTHRKEYVRWIVEAKRDETRRRRVERAVEMLREGKTNP